MSVLKHRHLPQTAAIIRTEERQSVIIQTQGHTGRPELHGIESKVVAVQYVRSWRGGLGGGGRRWRGSWGRARSRRRPPPGTAAPATRTARSPTRTPSPPCLCSREIWDLESWELGESGRDELCLESTTDGVLAASAARSLYLYVREACSRGYLGLV